ncbi:hypothetical protein GGF31_003437 [Allomyces arbusculus]|nr:hypothetical protein GGF31_003437 [Allomyces arbusculus]
MSFHVSQSKNFADSDTMSTISTTSDSGTFYASHVTTNVIEYDDFAKTIQCKVEEATQRFVELISDALRESRYYGSIKPAQAWGSYRRGQKPDVSNEVLAEAWVCAQEALENMGYKGTYEQNYVDDTFDWVMDLSFLDKQSESSLAEPTRVCAKNVLALVLLAICAVYFALTISSSNAEYLHSVPASLNNFDLGSVVKRIISEGILEMEMD